MEKREDEASQPLTHPKAAGGVGGGGMAKMLVLPPFPLPHTGPFPAALPTQRSPQTEVSHELGHGDGVHQHEVRFTEL